MTVSFLARCTAAHLLLRNIALVTCAAVLLVGAFGTAKCAQAWVRTPHTQTDYFSRTAQVDADGNVFSVFSEKDTVLMRKYSGRTGADVWSTTIAQIGRKDSTYADTALDGNGDVFVGIGVYSDDLVTTLLAKYSGASGEEVWAVTIGDSGFLNIGVDAVGDVFLLANVSNVFLLKKYAGTTGAVLWEENLAVQSFGSLAITAAGHAVVASGGTVVLMNGSTGDEEWSHDSGGRDGQLIAADSAGDIVVADVWGGAHILVVKLSAVDGNEVWSTQVQGNGGTGGFSPEDAAHDLAFDGNNNVLIAGRLRRYSFSDGPHNEFAVAKLDVASGAVVWTRRITSVSQYWWTPAAYGVVVDSNDDVIAVGNVDDVANNTVKTIVKLTGSSGTEIWRRSYGFGVFFSVYNGQESIVITGHDGITGLQLDGSHSPLGLSEKKFQISDPKQISARKVGLQSKDPNFRTDQEGVANDPTCGAPGGGGGLLRVVGVAGSGQDVSVPLPCQNWTVVMKSGEAVGYRYSDRDQLASPCSKGTFISGKGFKISCSGKNPSQPFTYDLTATGEGSVAVELSLGAGGAYCLEAPGATGTVNEDDESRFFVQESPAPTACNAP